jgi:S-adenosylmethionine-diacylgycerolhomoserine-N-methlytransferase
MDQATKMDRMYRYQRYIYDLTRKYYLLGRDRLLRGFPPEREPRVLEIGCGTGRNLLRLAELRPDARLFGVDVSDEMLRTARAKCQRRGVAAPLLCVPAEEVDWAATFALDAPFDIVYFSYTLSMIPTWPEALHAALRNVRPGGSFHVVDFWDQGGLPGWFRAVLTRWLRAFHVRHEPKLLERLEALGAAGVGRLTIEPVARRYAYIARLEDVDPAKVPPPEG